jgi:hypothetical protein
MGHALIINAVMSASGVIEDRLVPLGFDSFEHSWTVDQALAAMRRRFPDLIVAGDGIEGTRALDAIREIFAGFAPPVLRIATPQPAERISQTT